MNSVDERAAAGDMDRSQLTVAALTTGPTDPSARFRVRQHLATLRGAGVHVTEYVPRIDKHAGIPWGLDDRLPTALQPLLTHGWNLAKSATRLRGLLGARRADVAWLNRELLPGRYTLERYLSRPYALDIDDAVWRARPDGLATMARLAREAAVVIAGNRYLADWFSQHARRVAIVPTAIDTQRFSPGVGARANRPWTVGWTGSSGNYPYLYAIEEPLSRFLKETGSRLMVVADRAPTFSAIDPAHVDFVPWDERIEATALRDMDCGLMPLPDNEWTRGKCSFKMLQYMAVGIPVVVSPVGMNADVLAAADVGFAANGPQDWLDALMTLHRNPERHARMGEAGRATVLERYSVDVVSPMLAKLLRQAAKG